MSREVKFVESKGYYDEKSLENLRDLSHAPLDKANNLRIILESLGINQPKKSEVTKGSSTSHEAEEAIHHDQEGGGESMRTRSYPRRSYPRIINYPRRCYPRFSYP